MLRSLIEHDLSALLLGLGLVSARLAPAIWLAPFLGGRLVPGTVKTSLVLLLAALLLPYLAPQLQQLDGAAPPVLLALLAKEVMIGAALGFVAGLVFWAAEAAGRLADTARGASMGEVLTPLHDARTTPLGALYYLLFVVLFLTLGGHRLFIGALGASYQALPLDFFPSQEGLAALAWLAARLTADLLLLAVTLVAPVLGTIFLADATLGMLNRFLPQLNVFFLAMPLKALLGIAVVALTLGALAQLVPELSGRGITQVYQVLEALRR